jgi:hypothetical protein
VAAGERIHTLAFDLEAPDSEVLPDWPLVPGRFSGIVVTNYLHRPLLPGLLASLAPGGVLIYETFAEDNGLFGKPSNPAFLLSSGELLRTASSVPELHAISITPNPPWCSAFACCAGLPRSLPRHARWTQPDNDRPYGISVRLSW